MSDVERVRPRAPRDPIERAVLAVGLAVGLALLVAWPPVPGAAQGREVHGESSSFGGRGVALAWGVLRAATEEDTLAVLRIGSVGGAYTMVEVDGVDPFSRAREAILAAGRLADAPGQTVDVRTPRARFADFPRREVRLYRTAEDWQAGRPALTVYFLGLPDTTPEFTSEAALTAYLTAALAKAAGAAGEPAP